MPLIFREGVPIAMMRKRKHPGEILCVAAAVFAAVIVLAAQQKQTRGIPQHDAAAVVKLVPVRILDAEGRPVRGLRKEDFVLYDNNELKKITEFEVHESGENRVEVVETDAVIAKDVQRETNRKYFFVLDMQGSDLSGNRDAKKVALEFVTGKLKPGDEASVMTFGGLTGLVLRQYLTSDLEKIKKAIARSIAMGGTVGGSSGSSAPVLADAMEEERNRAIAEGQAAAARRGQEGEVREGSGGGTIVFSAGTSADAVFGNMGGIQMELPEMKGAARSKADFDMSMSELAKAMKYIPGIKSVVYFSTRTPGNAVGQLFAEANTTIYAVNSNGVPAKGGGAWASKGREVKKLQNEGLKDFAEASGGHFFADVANAATIAKEVEALSGNYYVLGYYINLSWDGRSHKIRVDVQRPDVRVLVQEGYNNPMPFASLTDLEKKMQLFDLAFSDKPASTLYLDLPLEVLLGPSLKEANAAVLLKLTVDERTGVPPGKTEICTFLFDKDQKIIMAERGEMDSAPHAQKTLFPYILTLLQPGEYECRVIARDLLTGQAVAGRLPFTVPKLIASGMSLASPLLLVPGKKPEFVRMARPKKKEINPVSIIRFFPFLPLDSVPLVSSLDPDVDKIQVLLPVSSGSKMPSKLDLSVELKRADGGADIPVDWKAIDRKRAEPAMDYLLFGITLPDLFPGTYRLKFTVVDAKTGARASVSAPLIKK